MKSVFTQLTWSVERPSSSNYRKCDLLCLKMCRPQQYGGELGSGTNDNVIIIRGRTCNVTFYIKMSRLAATIITVMPRRQNHNNHDIAWEGYVCRHGVAATTESQQS